MNFIGEITKQGRYDVPINKEKCSFVKILDIKLHHLILPWDKNVSTCSEILLLNILLTCKIICSVLMLTSVKYIGY